MSKKKDRFVRVDNGYGPASRYETVKVIQSRTINSLFSEEQKEELLVEGTGKERYWVAHWEEINDKV